MPFIAIEEGDEVLPDMVDDPTALTCPVCEASMHIREGHPATISGKQVYRSTHFVHNTNRERCGGGESPEHMTMKFVLADWLRDRYPDATVIREESPSGTTRKADALVIFDEPHDTLGFGVAGEAQYRHTDKDVEAVTRDYLDAGYSVLWAPAAAFTGISDTGVTGAEGVAFHPGSPAVSMRRVWPEALPPTEAYDGWGADRITSEVESVSETTRAVPANLVGDALAGALERELYLAWLSGNAKHAAERGIPASGYDPLLIQRLSETNADRKCGYCGDAAAIYVLAIPHSDASEDGGEDSVWPEGTLSDFRCGRHAAAGR